MNARFLAIVFLGPAVLFLAPSKAQEGPSPEEKPSVQSEALLEFQGAGKDLEHQFARFRRASWAQHRLAFLVEDARQRLAALGRGEEPAAQDVPAFPEPRLPARLKNLLLLDPVRASNNPAWIAQLLGRPCPDPPGAEDRADFLRRLKEPLEAGVETYTKLEATRKKEIEALHERLAELEREIAALGQAPPAPPAPAAPAAGKAPKGEPADPADEDYQERLMQEELRRRAEEQARKRAQGGLQPGQKPETPRPVQPTPNIPRPVTPAPAPVRPGPTPPPQRR